MKIYRVAKKRFINDLSGEGARIYGGRWNREGDAALYFCEHLSLCVLELLARMDYEFLGKDYWYIEAEISAKYFITIPDPGIITKNWRINPHSSTTQDYGSTWLKSTKSLGLVVASAILPSENNVIINPSNPSFSQLKIIKTSPLNLDDRIADGMVSS